MLFPAILPLQFGVAFAHLGVPRWDRSLRLHSLGEVLCPILSGNSPEARIVHLLLAPKTLARGKTPAGKIAKALKRTEGATRQKAFSLGVSLDSRA